MKLIISRKGFDSSSGGVPNPILPDGSMVPLPIPDPASPIAYGDIAYKSGRLDELVACLTGGKIGRKHGAHLDPDLDPASLPRPKRWLPLFGQHGAAQSHLAGKGVGPGDLFLFFGWFRQTETGGIGLRFCRNAPQLHALFGWLQVAQKWDIGEAVSPLPRWMRYHPHFHGERRGSNVIYQAAETLSLPGCQVLAGAGLFPGFYPSLRLTADGRTRSHWSLPPWFHPRGRASCLSYHEDSARWERARHAVLLRSAARGQDFVLDCDHYPEAIAWASGLIRAALRR